MSKVEETESAVSRSLGEQKWSTHDDGSESTLIEWSTFSLQFLKFFYTCNVLHSLE